MGVLVPTMRGDWHALALERALHARGERCYRWIGSDFPVRQRCTFQIDGSGRFDWQLTCPEFQFSDAQIRVVWLRRPEQPDLPAGYLHPDDVLPALRDLKTWWQSAMAVMCREAFWVNDPAAAGLAASKLMQLKLAPGVGLRIPETLVSNDHDDISRFIKSQSPEVIYKSFYPATWDQGEYMCVSSTALVRVEDLPSARVMQATPAIFQRRVPKAYEVRVTWMGGYYAALKLFSQEHAKAQLDWRVAPAGELRSEPCVLPPDIEAACAALMRALGIVFACFDFIVTPSGEFVFLEINEAGNFLFMEYLQPDLRLLDAFTEFLMNPSKDFQPTFKKPGLSFRELASEPAFLRSAELERTQEA